MMVKKTKTKQNEVARVDFTNQSSQKGEQGKEVIFGVLCWEEGRF